MHKDVLRFLFCGVLVGAWLVFGFWAGFTFIAWLVTK